MKGKTGWEDDQACNKGNKGVQETDIDAFSKQRTISVSYTHLDVYKRQVFTVMSRKYQYPVLTGLNLPMLIDLYLKLSNMEEADLHEEALLKETMETLQTSCVHTNTQLES